MCFENNTSNDLPQISQDKWCTFGMVQCPWNQQTTPDYWFSLLKFQNCNLQILWLVIQHLQTKRIIYLQHSSALSTSPLLAAATCDNGRNLPPTSFFRRAEMPKKKNRRISLRSQLTPGFQRLDDKEKVCSRRSLGGGFRRPIWKYTQKLLSKPPPRK